MMLPSPTTIKAWTKGLKIVFLKWCRRVPPHALACTDSAKKRWQGTELSSRAASRGPLSEQTQFSSALTTQRSTSQLPAAFFIIMKWHTLRALTRQGKPMPSQRPLWTRFLPLQMLPKASTGRLKKWIVASQWGLKQFSKPSEQKKKEEKPRKEQSKRQSVPKSWLDSTRSKRVHLI